MAEHEPEPVWVYAARAARIVGIDRRTIMRWIERGRLTPRIEGGPKQRRCLVRLDEVRQWAKSVQ